MATLESINNLLAIVARLLDQAASQTRDAELQPVQANVEHIGRALAEIFRLQHKIYEIQPDLKPKYLDEASTNPGADELLTRYMGEALGLEEAGDLSRAIEELREFLTLESSPHHRQIAHWEIERLSGG